MTTPLPADRGSAQPSVRWSLLRGGARVRLPWYSGQSLAALKWLALALMVVDHWEAFVLSREFDSQLGRLVFPVFAAVLGYNLARPGVDYLQLAGRLAVFGVIAQPFYVLLTGGPFGLPLNVLLTFCASVLVVCLVDRGSFHAAVCAFLVGGLLGEYWWPGIALVVGVWGMYSRPHSWAWVGVAMAALGGLCLLNGTATALLAVPLVYVMRDCDYTMIPRGKWVFYWFYPLHLALFVAFGAPGL